MMQTIISKDGTKIACNKSGNGPTVILIDGAFCSMDFGPMPKLVPLLSKHFTVITYDRRARGNSTDTQPYSVEREIEDIDALAQLADGPVNLFGISSGAILAIHAAAYGLNIDKLALLEPPFVVSPLSKLPPDNSQEQLSRLIKKGDRSGAVNFYLKKVIRLPAIIAFILRLTTNWAKMKANANSLPYDAAVCGNFTLPVEELSAVYTPAMVIDSTKSPQSLRSAVAATARVLPNGRQISLKGSIHGVPPKVLVPVLEKFYNGMLL